MQMRGIPRRPDAQRWRPFQLLSGGQQAVCSAALSFTLQAAAPLPLYYFDEVCRTRLYHTGLNAYHVIARTAHMPLPSGIQSSSSLLLHPLSGGGVGSSCAGLKSSMSKEFLDPVVRTSSVKKLIVFTTSQSPQVDAALDTANVERIAEYLAAQRGAQYLLVTHRPQVGQLLRSESRSRCMLH